MSQFELFVSGQDDPGIEKVKQHLLSGRSITGIQSLDKYGVYRLSDVVYKLRRRGFPIKTVMVKNSRGRAYASYTMEENNGNNKVDSRISGS